MAARGTAMRAPHTRGRAVHVAPAWGSVGVIVLVLLAMEALSLRTDLVPGPVAVAGAFAGMLGEATFYADMAATFSAIALGFAAACAVGLVVGVWIGTSAFWRRTLNDIIMGLYAMPKIIFFPIFLFAFGIGLRAEAATAFLFSVFPLLLNVEAGIRQVPPIYVRVSKASGATRRQTFHLVYLPAAMPAMLVGLRIAFSLSLIGAILSELFAAEQGLGRDILQYYDFQELPQMYALIAFLFAVGCAGNLVIWSVERRLSHGHDSGRELGVAMG